MFDIEELYRIGKINLELLKTLEELMFEILKFAKENHIELPKKLSSLVKKTNDILYKLDDKKYIGKLCSICGKLNPEDAKFCAYCGTTLGIITRFRHNDKSPENATKP